MKKNSYISWSVSLPNMFKWAEWRLTSWFATSINDILSTFAWFSCINERVLNLFWVIVERSHVLSHLKIEDNLSGVADFDQFVKTILMITTTFVINSRFWWDKYWMTLTTSLDDVIWRRWLVGIHTNDWK